MPGGYAGGNKGADVLPEAAAEVEVEGGRRGEERVKKGIEWVEGYGEVEEAQLADAGVGCYRPGTVALRGGDQS